MTDPCERPRIEMRIEYAFDAIGRAAAVVGWVRHEGARRILSHRVWGATFRRLCDDGALDAIVVLAPFVEQNETVDLERFVAEATAFFRERVRAHVTELPLLQVERGCDWGVTRDRSMFTGEECDEAYKDGKEAGRDLARIAALLHRLPTDEEVTLFEDAHPSTHADLAMRLRGYTTNVYIGDGMGRETGVRWRGKARDRNRALRDEEIARKKEQAHLLTKGSQEIAKIASSPPAPGSRLLGALQNLELSEKQERMYARINQELAIFGVARVEPREFRREFLGEWIDDKGKSE